MGKGMTKGLLTISLSVIMAMAMTVPSYAEDDLFVAEETQSSPAGEVNSYDIESTEEMVVTSLPDEVNCLTVSENDVELLGDNNLSRNENDCLLVGYQLTLNGSCDLQYLVQVKDEIRNSGEVYAEFTFGDNTVKAYPTNYQDKYQIYTCEVPAKNMADEITGVICCGEAQYSLGKYSVKEYLNEIISNENGNEECVKANELAKAVLNYGSYAQLYFEYNTDNLANDGIYDSNPVESITDVFVRNNIGDSFCGTKENDDFAYVGFSLTCKSDTDLNLYLSNRNNMTEDEITNNYICYITDITGNSIDSERLEISLVDGVMKFTLKDIPAVELGNQYTFNVENGTSNISIKYSPFDYIRKSMDSDNEGLKNLSKALYLYGIEAAKFFNYYSPVVPNPTPTTVPTQTVEKTTQLIDSEEETGIISNPDQGFYLAELVYRDESSKKLTIVKESSGNHKLIRLKLDISEFTKANNGTEDMDISDEYLNFVRTQMDRYRKQEKSVIARMCYSYGFGSDAYKEPQSIEKIKKHIKQMCEVYNEYPDVITALEVGMIGPWGEMHTSNYRNATDVSELMRTFLDETQANGYPILVRVPDMIYWYLGTDYSSISKGRFDITAHYNELNRIGVFNDGLFGTETDYGTYHNKAIELPLLVPVYENSVYGGEATEQEEHSHSSNCTHVPETVIPEMRMTHLNYLNEGFNENEIDYWKQATYTENGITYDSAFDYIANHMGYRFMVTSSIIERYITPGSDDKYDIALTIENRGFGNLNKSKVVSLIAVDSAGNETVLKSTPYTDGIVKSGSSKTIWISYTSAYKTLESGTYDLYVKVANADDKYAIQFANKDMWNNELKANKVGSIIKD